MAKSMFSSSWYRVSDMVPNLRSHLEIHRQQFRHDVWYIMQDQQAGRYHRLSKAGYLMLCLMDGRRNMQTIWEMLGQKLQENQPTQDECIALLTQLYMSDLLSGNVTPDLAELGMRAQKVHMRQLMSRIKNPLALRIPLVDPNRFLDLTNWLVAPLFSRIGFILWLGLIISGITLVGINWPDLTSNLADRLLTTYNFFLILLIYPVIKILHELGHGYAVKRWGGEVNEIGVMLLVLMPVPYVDASSSLAFREKSRRAFVGAAGIMVELALASIAMIVWANVEDGWVRAIAFNVMLVGGVSTLLFNGNPLLRFDGYYVLCDLVEIPNLGTRANKYFFYLIQRYLLGVRDAENPVTAVGESSWFLFYAIAAFLYRITVMVGIALFIATKLFFVGIVLACWSITSMFVVPVFKGAKFVLISPKFRSNRLRVITISAVFIGTVVTVLFGVPVPYATVVQGIVWASPNTQVRVQAEGVISEILVEPNQMVTIGDDLLRMENSELAGNLKLLEAQLREFQVRLNASRVGDRIQSQLIKTQIENIEGAVSVAKQTMQDLVIKAPQSGQFVLPNSDSLIGLYMNKGDQLGLVAYQSNPIIRVVVQQGDVDLIRNRTEKVDLRFVHLIDKVLAAKLIANSPSATDQLPDRSLSFAFGGDILTDPSDGSGLKPLENVFEFDVSLQDGAISVPVGLRAYIRFDHGAEPIIYRAVRNVRQLLLAMFDV